MWAAVELETIAKQYYYALALNSMAILSEDQIKDTQKGFATYGLQEIKPERKARTAAAEATGTTVRR